MMSLSAFKPRWFAVVVMTAGLLVSPAAARAQQTAPPAQQTGSAPETQAGTPAPAPDPHAAAKRAAERQALGFLRYLDQGRYAESYAYTSRLLRARTSAAEFARQVKKDREPDGAKVSRKILDATYTTSLQGQPAGKYIVLQYNSDLAKKKDAVETLVMSYENGYWRVAGWYIK